MAAARRARLTLVLLLPTNSLNTAQPVSLGRSRARESDCAAPRTCGAPVSASITVTAWSERRGLRRFTAALCHTLPRVSNENRWSDWCRQTATGLFGLIQNQRLRIDEKRVKVRSGVSRQLRADRRLKQTNLLLPARPCAPVTNPETQVTVSPCCRRWAGPRVRQKAGA